MTLWMYIFFFPNFDFAYCYFYARTKPNENTYEFIYEEEQ